MKSSIKKQTFLLLLFVSFVLIAPSAFAYSSRIAAPLKPPGRLLPSPSLSSGTVRPGRTSSLSSPSSVVTGDTSSPSFIRFRCTNMNFRSLDNLKEVKTVLGPNSIVQLPNFPGLGIQVHEYNQDGSINFDKTIENWLQMAKYRSSELRSRHLIPKRQDGELYLPVKIIQASDSGFNTRGRNAYGYLALDFMRKKVNPRCYEATTRVSEEMLSVPQIIGGESVSNGEFNDQPSETTNSGNITGRYVEHREDSDDLSKSRIFNCHNTHYRRHGYSRHSCLRSMNLEEKARLVMEDVAQVNKLRPELKLDPRFSLCIAYRESGISPNAQGASNDSGIYQITDSTARDVLRMHNPVTPFFRRHRGNQRRYKQAMLKSTLAQADIHHSIILAKAKREKLLHRINRNPEDTRLLQILATRYNGSGQRARHYGRKVSRCYQAMKQVASADGQIHNSSGLKRALRRARG